MNVQIAAGWQQERLEALLCEGPTNGYSPQSTDNASGTLSLRLSATTQGYMLLNENTTKRLLEKIPPSSPFWLRPGDLLVQRSNTLEYLGSAAIFDGPEQTYIYPDLMMRLRCPDPATTRWIWRYLNTNVARDYFRRVAGGTAGSMPKISGEKLRDLVLPVPPLAEQRRLTAILDKADAIRRKRQEAIALTEQLLRSTFLEMFGDIPARRSPWPWGTARGHVEMSSGKSPKDVISDQPTEYPIYGGNGINGWAKVPLYRESIIIVGRVGQQCGIVHMSETPCWVTDNAIVIRVVAPDVLDPVYLAEAFQASPIRDIVSRLDLPFINQEMLRDQPIPIPPIEAQAKYSALRRAMLHTRSDQARAHAEADTLFQSLVQRAFSGQL